MEIKEKNATAQLKKISSNIETSRKNIESDSNIIENITKVKGTFNQLESVIKSQTPNFEAMKNFSKEISSESSKNLELKVFFHEFFDRNRNQMKNYFEVIRQNFVLNHRSKEKQNWDKVEKEFEKYLALLREEADNAEKMYAAVTKILLTKDYMVVQMMKLMIYRKNVLWRDLNAPYNDYIHGEIKGIINHIKQCQQKYGYTPATLEFILPSQNYDIPESSLPELFKIVLNDHREIVDGLKNYAKLSDAPQVIEDISKNQHIVKGLREKIEILTKNNEVLMEKYRSLQISKGKVVQGSSEQKSLTDKIDEYSGLLNRKQQEIIELKQNAMKSESQLGSLKEKTKQLEDELSKWHKFQLPKIKEMEGNQKTILEEFNKVKRDLQTYGNIVQVQRDEKIKTIEDLKQERIRVMEFANILGRERRKIKELKQQIAQQQKINLELADRIVI